ncbi:ABC transporter substrate-binding protein [Romboutsia sp.]|uniref:ABC transporter substrate-binding protein n=1 Tax=Romboutsia sp. TaxID=1965302 RepID=UPI003F2E9BD3
MKNRLKVISVAMTLALTLVGCTPKEEAKDSKIGGTITVVTDRTDADELFAQMEKDFIAKYPEVEDIVWESSADYDSYITTRMNTKDYGDVLLVPFSMSGNPSEYSNYFEPLGKVEELEKEYIDVTEADYDGVSYGLPVALNSLGIIYNENVLKEAGIEQMPTTVEDFIKACEEIKEKTDAVPFYTNYQRAAVWGGALTSFGGEQYRSEMLKAGTAFEEGQPIREVMDIFYNLTSKGLTEADPITLDGAKAQQMLANGEIAMMMMGSQDVPVIQGLNDKNTINIAPFPVELDGKTSLALGAPGVIGVNKNSSNIETSKAFLEFFVSAESKYADNLGGMTPKKSDLTNENNELIKNNNVILTVPTETTETEEKYALVANQVGVARLSDALQKVINIGLYPNQNEKYEDYIKSLEADWVQAVKDNE